MLLYEGQPDSSQADQDINASIHVQAVTTMQYFQFLLSVVLGQTYWISFCWLPIVA